MDSGAKQEKLLHASFPPLSPSLSPSPPPYHDDTGDGEQSAPSLYGLLSASRHACRHHKHRTIPIPSRLRIYLHRFVSRRLVLSLLLVVQVWWLYLWNSRSEEAALLASGQIGHYHNHQQYLTAIELKTFEAGLASCAALATEAPRIEAKDRIRNPRWEANNARDSNTEKAHQYGGQKQQQQQAAETITTTTTTTLTVLRNATLFDGEAFLPHAVDIVISKGLVVSLSPTTANNAFSSSSSSSSSFAQGTQRVEEINLHGAYLTPGLVDMHSHHLAAAWPLITDTRDENEMHDDFGPLTPFVRILDSLKAYDEATARIASGGVTTSLIIPGSANIIGGEGTVVKNAVRPGRNGEFVVEEMLLEHGVADGEEKHRYMKMACGENPKRVYGHTRMGNVWVLRKWLARAKEVLEKQDAWCEAAQMAATGREHSDGANEAVMRLLADKGGFPEELELDSTVGLLRGRVALHNHCYEPEDMETMLRVSHEFGFHVKAFHHALAAWQIPEMLKEYGENVTVATFAEFSLYKQEAYGSSLYAGKILNDHGVPVAYKSDHVGEDTSAQYLMLQPAVAHSFGLPENKALQSVTSVPARALDLHNRVGFVRPGYDADLVVWDAHPLSVGATPKQIYIDGVAQLDPAKVAENTAHVVGLASGEDEGYKGAAKPEMRASITREERERTCINARKHDQKFVVTGIDKSLIPGLLDTLSFNEEPWIEAQDLVLIVQDGAVTCLGSSVAGDCSEISARLMDHNEALHIHLKNGHLTRGLTAVTASLGIAEISMAEQTGDGSTNVIKVKEAQDAENIGYAKYAVTLGGSKVSAKSFARARLGGVTRAIQSPITKGGLIVGVSTGLRTGLNSTLLNGGIFQDDVAMHVILGDEAKDNDGSVSVAVEKLRALVKAGSSADGADATHPWALVANGSLPLVIKATANHDIQQSILLKKDHPNVNVVLLGGHEAPLFANELAAAKVPLILTGNHAGLDSWRKREALPGPPLSRSPADILHEAGVLFGIACPLEGPPGDSRIHSTALEAAWAAKYAGLSEVAALDLVSTNIEQILGLEKSGDIVVWEGNPLQFGTPVLTFQSQNGWLEVSSCWPNEADE